MKNVIGYIFCSMLSCIIGAILMGLSISYTIEAEAEFGRMDTIKYMKHLGKEMQHFLLKD